MSGYETEAYRNGVFDGEEQERERIIALLEAKDEWHYEFSDVSDVIALIKGETE